MNKKQLIASEARAARKAALAQKALAAKYKASFDRLNAAIAQLYADTADGDVITRAQLYQYSRDKNLRDMIAEEFNLLTSASVSEIDSTLTDIYTSTLGERLEDLKVPFIGLRESEMKAILETN